MSGPDAPGDANSTRRWEERFISGEWEANHGSELTAAFAKVLLEHLSPAAAAVLSIPGITVLDWGCALGELAGAVKDRFPRALVEGQDTSSSAIAKARLLHPQVNRFYKQVPPHIYHNWGVTICSNVYEHIVDYKASLTNNLQHSLAMHLLLVPHNEWLGDEAEALPTARDRDEEGWCHIWRFNEDHFPGYSGWSRSVDITLEPGPVWPGRQLMVTYIRKQLLLELDV